MSENIEVATVEEKPVVEGPADALRRIQGLLVGGIFPGNMAPEVVKAYSLLDNMAKQVEADHAKKSA